MNSFDNIQCDDFLSSDDFLAWAADLDRHVCDEEEANRELAEAAYEWSEEAIEWEEGFHPDNLYECDDDPVHVHEDELFWSTGGQCWD